MKKFSSKIIILVSYSVQDNTNLNKQVQAQHCILKENLL